MVSVLTFFKKKKVSVLTAGACDLHMLVWLSVPLAEIDSN
jgi:hypothetical protein